MDSMVPAAQLVGGDWHTRSTPNTGDSGRGSISALARPEAPMKGWLARSLSPSIGRMKSPPVTSQPPLCCGLGSTGTQLDLQQ